MKNKILISIMILMVILLLSFTILIIIRNTIPTEVLSSKTADIEKIEIVEHSGFFTVYYYLYNKNGRVEKTMSKNVLNNKYNCGGFAGISCPVGYQCEYSSNYFDKLEKCVKK